MKLFKKRHVPFETAPCRASERKLVPALTCTLFPVLLATVLTLASSVAAHASGPTLADAQRAFFNARYQAAADLALEVQGSEVEALAAYEVRTSALHFQLRDALGPDADKGKAFKLCVACPELLKFFLHDTAKGQALARERLQRDPGDDDALFFLGKLNLNYVWLHLETLGRKTGWSDTGKREGHSTRRSKTIHDTCALVWREPGSTTSLTPKWREARAGCSVAAVRNARFSARAKPRPPNRSSLSASKPNSRCGKCWCATGN